jgi:hypothetical protein
LILIPRDLFGMRAVVCICPFKNGR